MVKKLSVDTIVYEVVVRIFRNSFVGFLRSSLSDVQPPDIERLFTADQWAKARANRERTVEKGYVTRRPVDIFDELDVSHFYNVADTYFRALFPEVAGRRSLEESLRRDVRRDLRSIKGVRDPVAHPAAADMSAVEALVTTEAVLRLLERIDDKSAHESALDMKRELVSRLVSHGHSDTHDLGTSALQVDLPLRETIVTQFIGREGHLAELWAWIADARSGRRMLIGDGGKGKSSIAYGFACSVAESGAPDLWGVLWLSAKARRFDDGSVIEIGNPDFHDLESCLDRILDFYAESTKSLGVDLKKQLVLENLAEYPILLIADDLDTIPLDDDSVIDFVTIDAARAGSKILTTSRRPFPGFSKAKIEVTGFDLNESEAFLRSRGRDMSLQVHSWGDKRLRQIHSVCEGSPLYMEDLLRLAKTLSIRKAVDQWSSTHGSDARRYSLRREVEMLSTGGKEVMKVLALADSALTADLISAVLQASSETVHAGLNELAGMYLTAAPELVEDIPRFSLAPNLRSLIRDEVNDPQSSLHDPAAVKKVRNALASLAGGGIRRDRSEVQEYAREAHAAFRKGEHDRAEQILMRGMEEHPNSPRLHDKMAWISKVGSPRRVEMARQHWNRAYQLGASQVGLYREWCIMEIDEEQWAAAAEVAERWNQRCGVFAQALQLGAHARLRRARQLRQADEITDARSELRQAQGMLARALSRGKVNTDGFDESRAHNDACLVELNLYELGEAKYSTLMSRIRDWESAIPADPFLSQFTNRHLPSPSD